MTQSIKSLSMLLTLLLAITLIGCGASIQKKMQSWVGADESQLLSSWGAPDTSLDTADGKRIHTWKTLWNYNGNMYTCRQSFTIDTEGKVEKWSYAGC